MQNSVIPKKPKYVETTPLDTESFYMDENQESPIDLINTTTKMRHLEANTLKICDDCNLKQIEASPCIAKDLKVLIVDCRI